MKKLFILFLLLPTFLISCEKERSIEEEIKLIYCSEINAVSIQHLGYPTCFPWEVTIKYYLGQYGEAHCAVIEGDISHMMDANPFYTVSIDGYKFEFKYLPEYISVYYNKQYYSVQLACTEGILTLENVQDLYDYCVENIF